LPKHKDDHDAHFVALLCKGKILPPISKELSERQHDAVQAAKNRVKKQIRMPRG
jgi:hypothetical protein